MHKIRYEVDPHNRLIIGAAGEKSGLRRFRRALDGKFSIGPGNSLIYRVKSPLEGVTADYKAPHQVKLRGTWSLDRNHNLVLTLNKWRRQIPGDELTLEGELLSAESNSLTFALTTRSKENTASVYILALKGAWQADERNRIIFRAIKGKDRYDTLIFDGIWEIGKNHRIIYSYEKTKKGVRKTLTFKGFWAIAARNRISYLLDVEGKSVFNFRTGLGFLDKDSLKYEVGIGISRKKRPVRRVITLYGTWKIKKDTGLVFEIEYEKGRPGAITFGADARLNGIDTVEFRLRDEFHKDLGMELTLSRRLLKGDGEAFLRLLKSRKEAVIYAGAAWRW